MAAPAHAVRVVTLDGAHLRPEDLLHLGSGDCRLELSAAAWESIAASRNVVDGLLATNTVAYGINTGFGLFSEVVIPPGELCELQRNLIRSHAAGIGDYLPRHRGRQLLALRLNVLAKGHSGISIGIVEQALAAFNADCISAIPEKGTVGASGDLAPLAHLALGLMGEGPMWDPRTGEVGDASDILAAHGLQPLMLGPKEGLALINGTQLIASLTCEALMRAENVARCADVAVAMTLEALKGTVKAFHPRIHAARPHAGQQEVAARLRALLNVQEPSEMMQARRNSERVQDAYSLRCSPQVHGVVHDTLQFVRSILMVEINSATDNPMVFAGEADQDGFIISGGNFHGEYPAKAADFLAIAVHELANISERRIERLVNPDLSELPAFLVGNGGLHSGFMIAHCTAAALTSENKTLVHPGSSDTISTSAAKEDHVSMGGWAARKALQVVENVETVIAVELLAGCQALEFFRPLRSTPAIEAVHSLVRTRVAPWDKDRHFRPDLVAMLDLVRSGALWQAVAPHL